MKSLGLVWVFNIVGSADLILALVNAIRYDATSYPIGSSWFTLNFFVPLLYVTHFLIFRMLIRKSL